MEEMIIDHIYDRFGTEFNNVINTKCPKCGNLEDIELFRTIAKIYGVV
ncbi:MAG: hypothetical protein HQK97_05035 [Nitrospirae bacterium]|nr:hypothetical protein [Nitrospirota bacterium]